MKTLRARLLGRAHGEATLLVEAMDAAGEPVRDLTAGAFALAVDNEPHPFLLLANRPQLEVTILIDQSLSMPADYLGQAGVMVDKVLQRAAAGAGR